MYFYLALQQIQGVKELNMYVSGDEVYFRPQFYISHQYHAYSYKIPQHTVWCDIHEFWWDDKLLAKK